MRAAPLDRYVLVERLGEGPAGPVDLAYVDAGPAPYLPSHEDVALAGRRWVAVKRIDPVRVGLDGPLFESLVGAIAELHERRPFRPHGLVRPFEVFSQSGAIFVVSEYVHGVTLGELVRLAGRVPLPVARALVWEAAMVLSVDPWPTKFGVHGHLSRNNLFVTFEGKLVIADLHVARLLQPRTVHPSPEKLAYLSPEQAAGGAPDERSDVFTLGVHLWELAAGKRLFRRETADETRAAVEAYEVPRLRVVAEDASPELEETLMRALSKDPAQRPPRHELVVNWPTLEKQPRLIVDARESMLDLLDASAYLQPLLADAKRAREERLRSFGYRGGSVAS